MEFVGVVTIEERDLIYMLHEKKTALKHLLNIVEKENINLIEKIVRDLRVVEKKFSEWWINMSKHYKWKKIDGKEWTIDFNKCQVFLLL